MVVVISSQSVVTRLEVETEEYEDSYPVYGEEEMSLN